MANRFWNFVLKFSAGTLAKAEDVNTNLSGVNTGLDDIASELDQSIQVVTSPGTTHISENAASRANKLIQFGTAGGVELGTVVGDYKGNHADAAGTDYYVRDVVKDAAGRIGLNNIYICNAAHTSTGTILDDTANWDLLISVAEVEAAKVAAEAAQVAAELAYDSFDDRYLGEKPSEPALDNDDDALLTGALFFHAAAVNRMKVYNGAAWQLTTANAVDVALADAAGLVTAIDVENAIKELAYDVRNSSLVRNGNFGNGLTDWTQDTSGGGTIALNTTTVASGVNSAELSVAAPGESCFIDTEMFDINTVADHSLKYYDTAKTGVITHTISILKYDAAELLIGTTVLVTSASAATGMGLRYLKITEAVIGLAVKAKIRFEATYLGAADSYIVDDVKVAPNQRAAEISVADTASNFTADDLETILAEIHNAYKAYADSYFGAVTAWSPEIDGEAVSGTPTYTSQDGKYQITGNQIRLWGKLTVTSLGACVGNMVLTNLPFTMVFSNARPTGRLVTQYLNFAGTGHAFPFLYQETADVVGLRKGTDDNALGYISNTDFFSGAGATTLFFDITMELP